MKLATAANIVDADEIYERLIALHHGRSDEDSMRVNAKLILLLINHIGDPQVVREAIGLAARDARTEES